MRLLGGLVREARRHFAIGGAALAALALSIGATVALGDSGSATVTYTATQTIPVPPASDYQGSGGGDGWAVALSDTQVFNVFHHNGDLNVVCHNQSDATTCWGPTRITDTSGNHFATSGQPGMYLDPNTGKLYVYATRTSDSTGGVVCVDTTLGTTSSDPFCGFTALTGVGEASLYPGYSELSNPVLVGNHLYSFNYVPGSNVSGTENELLCFDVSTDLACATPASKVNFNSSGTMDYIAPAPGIDAINGDVVIKVSVGGAGQLACFNDSTGADCGASWPASAPDVDDDGGDPFAMLDSSGNPIGVCLPNGSVPCWDLNGNAVATPANLPTALSGGSAAAWDGPGLTIGPRVYIPQWSNDVACFDFSTGASCNGFPKSFDNLDLLYSVNADPQRPTCIWVNSDNGSEQIQNFDAFTGGGCGEGPTRVLASQFIVPRAACFPTSYDSLQVTQPAASTFDTSGAPSGSSITFEDADGNPISGVPTQYLDSTGAVNLQKLSLNGPLGLPQFLITLANPAAPVASVTVKLTWEDAFDPTCTSTSVTATQPTSTTNTVTVTVTNTTTTTTPVTTTLKTASPATTPTCPPPVGAVGGSAVGVFSIGMTQNQARQTMTRYHVTENKFDNFCLYHGWGIRLGYPTSTLLKTVAKSQRSQFKGHVVLALTANPFYALTGARPGQSVASVAKRLHLGKAFHVGSNNWYFGSAGYERGIVKVRHGVIQEVGLASLGLTQTAAQQRVFINSFDKF